MSRKSRRNNTRINNVESFDILLSLPILHNHWYVPEYMRSDWVLTSHQVICLHCEPTFAHQDSPEARSLYFNLIAFHRAETLSKAWACQCYRDGFPQLQSEQSVTLDYRELVEKQRRILLFLRQKWQSQRWHQPSLWWRRLTQPIFRGVVGALLNMSTEKINKYIHSQKTALTLCNGTLLFINASTRRHPYQCFCLLEQGHVRHLPNK